MDAEFDFTARTNLKFALPLFSRGEQGWEMFPGLAGMGLDLVVGDRG